MFMLYWWVETPCIPEYTVLLFGLHSGISFVCFLLVNKWTSFEQKASITLFWSNGSGMELHVFHVSVLFILVWWLLQARILGLNASYYLKAGGHFVISIKVCSETIFSLQSFFIWSIANTARKHECSHQIDHSLSNDRSRPKEIGKPGKATLVTLHRNGRGYI